MTKPWDVIVVGGGPGGALAAKKCAENGLKTLLLEKKKIPRDKCCSGMVMGPWGQTIIKEEFGEYPPEVMHETENLHGYAVHVPGVAMQTYDVHTPATWRKLLDTWLCRQASESGAEVWDGTRLTGLSHRDEQCILRVEQGGRALTLSSTFLIAADGANSRIRRCLFPDLKPKMFTGYRQCYEDTARLPKERFNIFISMAGTPIFFIHFKKQYMLLEGVALKGKLKEVIAQARQVLIENHGFSSQSEPIWQDGCVEPEMYHELTTGLFRPALVNTLLVGDAAGLNIPVSGEGLTTSLKSGLEAANAVIEAKNNRKEAGPGYLLAVDELLKRFKDIKAYAVCIKKASENEDPQAFSDAWLASWGYSLNL